MSQVKQRPIFQLQLGLIEGVSLIGFADGRVDKAKCPAAIGLLTDSATIVIDILQDSLLLGIDYGCKTMGVIVGIFRSRSVWDVAGRRLNDLNQAPFAGIAVLPD